MKLFGSITELVKIVLRKSGFEVTVEPSTASAATTFQLPAAAGGTKTLVTTDDSQTLSNKTIDATSSVNVSALPSIPDTKLDTISTAGKVSNSATTATSSNTASAIVARDASGNFSAGTITASLSGNASTATSATSAANLTGSNLTGDVTNVANATTVASVGGKTSTEVATSVDDTQDATDLNTPSTIVKRDASGNFSAGTINGSVVTSTGNTTGGLKLPVGNATTERPSGTASQLKGMVRYNDTDDVFEGYNELSGWSSIGGGGTTDRVTQVSHSFVVGDVLYLNGSTYAKAKADAANTAEVVGMVSRVIDSNTFELTLSGEVSGLSGLTVGEVYFLSAATAGAVSSTEPSVVGHVSLPVGVANSTTSIYVQPKRGVILGGANVRTQISLANNTTNSIQDVSAYEAGELSGWVSIAATTSYKFYVEAQFSKNGAGTDYSVSFQTSGDIPPSGFLFDITSAGILQCIVPNVAGFASASINYGLNVAAVGATLPLSISASNVIGDVSGSAVPAGYIGQVLISKVISSTNAAASNTNLQLTTLTLTPGVWLLSGGVTYLRNSSTPIGGNHSAAITTGAGNVIDSSAQLEVGFEAVNIVSSSTSRFVFSIAPAVVSVSTNTTYNLNCLALYSAGTPQWRGHIQAVRIA